MYTVFINKLELNLRLQKNDLMLNIDRYKLGTLYKNILIFYSKLSKLKSIFFFFMSFQYLCIENI